MRSLSLQFDAWDDTRIHERIEQADCKYTHIAKCPVLSMVTTSKHAIDAQTASKVCVRHGLDSPFFTSFINVDFDSFGKHIWKPMRGLAWAR
jgi:hypothetical protein